MDGESTIQSSTKEMKRQIAKTDLRVQCINAGIFNLTNDKIYPVTHEEAECYHIIDDTGKENDYSKTRFKLMKYNIGDVLVCVNNQDSDSLELNEAYVVVDINEHGNIGVRHPSSGSLLRHYYKPERFDRIKQEVIEPVGFGQYYQRWKAIYVVAGIGGKYALVDIENGFYWDDPCDNIEKVFAGERDKFKQVYLEIKIKK